jgi:predicted ArsR family transcriptional regulator
MQATRQEILDYLRRCGHATVRELGEHLGLTSTGIRQHLTVLERDGLVEAAEERGHVGRPALVYRLTPEGDGLYPKMYDVLANALIEEVRGLLGPETLQKLLKNVAGRFSRQNLPRVEGKAATDRLEETARIMADGGNVVDAHWSGDDYLIRKHTCPYWNVATRNSSVCALEVEVVRQLAGADARLSSSLLRGDESCTFRVRPPLAAGGNGRNGHKH